MPQTRQIKVRVLRAGVATSADMDAADKTVTYDGKPVTVKL
jgi:alpha-D-xyloside xylohydrolase